VEIVCEIFVHWVEISIVFRTQKSVELPDLADIREIGIRSGGDLLVPWLNEGLSNDLLPLLPHTFNCVSSDLLIIKFVVLLKFSLVLIRMTKLSMVSMSPGVVMTLSHQELDLLREARKV
jgi:hypothetical protein